VALRQNKNKSCSNEERIEEFQRRLAAMLKRILDEVEQQKNGDSIRTDNRATTD
jgi:hypothetical protein